MGTNFMNRDMIAKAESFLKDSLSTERDTYV